jgi:kynurenine formamidase
MRVKRIIDLSQPFEEGEYRNPAFGDGRVEVIMRHETEGWHAEAVHTATHVGSHVDAPMHKLADGIPIEGYPLERFIGEAIPVNLYHKRADEEITEKDLFPYDEQFTEGINVLLCTGWADKKKPETKDEYLYHSPWLGEGASRYLVRKKVNGVGIDHFSIGGANPAHVEIPHDILLQNQVVILEGLRLPQALFERDRWLLCALPVMVKNASGSIVRAAAVELGP